MGLNIIEERNNLLLDRKDVVAELDHDADATPSYDQVRKEIVKHYGVDPDSIVIDSVRTKAGVNTARITFKIYAESLPPSTTEPKEEVELDAEEEHETVEGSEDGEEEETEASDASEEPETSAESESEADYEELVSGTVSDLKDALEDFDGDLNALLEAEKNNKNRKTAVAAIESAMEE